MLKEFKLYNGKEIIRFDDEKHWFYDGRGSSIISVTGITGVIDKSGALMGWAVNQMADYLLASEQKEITQGLIDAAKKEYRRLKKEAADIGTQIHEWISEWIAGKKPDMPDNERVVNGITAFLKFQKEHKAKWLESERIVYSKKHKYAGILDAIAEIDGNLILVDFKSSNGIYDEMRFQVAGYQMAYEEETKKNFDGRMIIRFGKDTGEFEVKNLDSDEKDKKAFLACLALKTRLNELK